MQRSWRDSAGTAGTAGTTFDLHKREAVASRGMVASNHPLASAAGVEMLALGGNAFDAAVATAFALSVVEPMMVGPFGAGFVNIHHGATGESTVIDNYAIAPRGAAPDLFEPVSDHWPDYLETVGRKNKLGYLAVGVPGNLKAWCEISGRYGRLGLDTLVQPAIRYARRGYPASRYLVDCIRDSRNDIARFDATAAVFLPAGAPPAPGDAIVMEDLAVSLELIAAQGADALYDGPLGAAVAGDMAARGGLITQQDLREYETHERAPVRGTYRGYEIVSTPPTSSGGTHIVQMLNLLEGFDIAALGFGTAAYVHLLSDVLKIAYADRFEYMADPAFVRMPIAGLISKEYARARRGEINRAGPAAHRAGDPVAFGGESSNTTHLTVADDQGNVVAMTQTLNELFGSKVTVAGTGLLLNNTMSLFDPHPGNANSVAPGKRMLSSMSPTVVLKDGKPFMALGTPGGTRIFPAVLQAIVNVIDFGMTLQEAVEAPRVWTQGQALEVEHGIAEDTRRQLRAMGHEVKVVSRVAGGMNGVQFDHHRGLIHGAACWRADGTPVGISGGPAKPGVTGPTYVL
jgi:gamma-glutamyltranspeptidase/glutathione hydrolase